MCTDIKFIIFIRSNTTQVVHRRSVKRTIWKAAIAEEDRKLLLKKGMICLMVARIIDYSSSNNTPINSICFTFTIQFHKHTQKIRIIAQHNIYYNPSYDTVVSSFKSAWEFVIPKKLNNAFYLSSNEKRYI